MSQLLITEVAGAVSGILVDVLQRWDIGVLLLDANLRARFINRQFASFFQLPPAMLTTHPSFREMLHQVEFISRDVPPTADLLDVLDRREAAVRAGPIPPTVLTLRDGRRLLSTCSACRGNGRILTYTDISTMLDNEARQQSNQTNAETRFSREIMEEQAAYLASMAEAADLSSRQIEASRLALEQEITERCHLEARLRRLASVDGLTGALNRAGFMMAAEQVIEQRCRPGHQHALLMLDVDHFKAINDRFGHAGGDLALQHLVATLRSGIRQSDLLGRLGGEEFAIVLPHAPPRLADQVAERMRVQVADNPLPFGARMIEMTISVGLAAKHEQNSSLELLLARADDALYRAKNAGRNRVVRDQQETTV